MTDQPRPSRRIETFEPVWWGLRPHRGTGRVRASASLLVRHRTSQDWSQSAAAGRIGMDPGTLARWERGEREPTGAFTALARKKPRPGNYAIAS